MSDENLAQNDASQNASAAVVETPSAGAGQSTDADAQVRFSGTKDRMKVGIAGYSPPTGNGRPLTVERLRDLLTATGVKVPLDEAKAEEAIRRLQAGESVEKLVVARGTPAENGRDGAITPIGDFDFPVFPEQPFAEYTPAVFPASGVRVDGSEISPEEPYTPTEICVDEESACRLDENAEQLIAKQFGIVQVDSDGVRVVPLINIAEDHMSATITLFHRDAEGDMISPERMLLVLEGMGIHPDRIDREVLIDSLARADRTGKCMEDVLVATGSEPKHGENGWVQVLAVNADCIGGGCGEEGRVDYKDRGFAPTVKEGEEAAIIHPPTLGQDGMTVLGRVLKARDGKPSKCTLESTVRLEEDGTTVIALESGLVQYTGGKLSIQDILVVKGDVDYSTGNVKVDTGSIQVGGTVLSGFTVKAPESLQVKDVIEAAEIVAGGDVEVGGGIIMQGEGHIRCGGKVSAEFINEADIIALGDVIVNKSIQHSHVVSGGMVSVLGNGVIQGGTTVARKGIEAIEVGSELDVETHLVITGRSREEDKLNKDREKIRQQLDKLHCAIGDGSDELVLQHAPPEQYEAIEKALAMRHELLKRMEAVRERWRELQAAKHGRLAKCTIKVSGTVHPHTVVTFGESTFAVSHTLIGAVFRYSANSHEIEVTSADVSPKNGDSGDGMAELGCV